MTNEVLEKVREVTSFVRGLHEEYQMYQSALFRSLNWMASSNSPWRMLAASLVFQQAPPTADFKTETVFPNLTVAERALDLSTSEAALDSLATSGVIKLDEEEFFLGLPVSLDDPETRGSHDKWGLLGEVSNGIECFLHSQEPLPANFVSPSQMKRLGLENVYQVVWHLVIWPRNPIPPSPYLKPHRGIYVLVPFEHAAIADATLERNKLQVSTRTATGVPASDFELVATAYGAHGAFPPKRQSPLQSDVSQFEFETDVSLASVRLYWLKSKSQLQEYVDSVSGRRASLASYPELDVHRLFDKDLSAISDCMKPSQTDSKKLEWAVSTVLTLAGFQVEWLGFLGKQWKEGEIDLLAYLRKEHILLLGECTTAAGEISNKIALLAERSKPIKVLLDTWIVKKVLFTNRDSAALPRGTEEAARELEITILPSTLLLQLVAAVRGGFTASELGRQLDPGMPASIDGPWD